jgi:hypothetical protein
MINRDPLYEHIRQITRELHDAEVCGLVGDLEARDEHLRVGAATAGMLAEHLRHEIGQRTAEEDSWSRFVGVLRERNRLLRQRNRIGR